jgi:hypothetical protein
VSFRGAKCKEGLVYIFAEGMKECERVFQKPVSSSLLFLVGDLESMEIHPAQATISTELKFVCRWLELAVVSSPTRV